jgi:glutathione S-transferase
MPPTLRLHDDPLSHFAARCRIAIYEKGLPLERVTVSDAERASSAFRTLSPFGKVPVLEVDGLVLVESEVINEYVDDRFPDPPLRPADAAARARMRLVSRFHDLYFEPPLHGLWLDPTFSDRAATARYMPEAVARLKQLERLVGAPWAAGDAFSLADCALAPTMLYAGMVMPALGSAGPLDGRPRLAAWWDRVVARPSVARVHAEQRAGIDTALARR